MYNSVWSARHERWIPVGAPTPRIRNPTSVTSFSFAPIKNECAGIAAARGRVGPDSVKLPSGRPVPPPPSISIAIQTARQEISPRTGIGQRSARRPNESERGEVSVHRQRQPRRGIAGDKRSTTSSPAQSPPVPGPRRTATVTTRCGGQRSVGEQSNATPTCRAAPRGGGGDPGRQGGRPLAVAARGRQTPTGRGGRDSRTDPLVRAAGWTAGDETPVRLVCLPVPGSQSTPVGLPTCGHVRSALKYALTACPTGFYSRTTPPTTAFVPSYSWTLLRRRTCTCPGTRIPYSHAYYSVVRVVGLASSRCRRAIGAAAARDPPRRPSSQVAGGST